MSYPLLTKSPRPEMGDFLSSPSPNNIQDKKQDFSILQKLKDLRDQKKFCDIILEVRGTKLEAHKNVLASWSPYFAAKMFPNDNTVCRDYAIVNYNNSEVFADLLDFMYNGYVAPRETNFLELLHLAVSFQIQMLKNYCEEFLRCNLHLGNFVSTYFLSRKFTLESLEEYIVGFLQLNLSDAVKQGEFLSLNASKFNTFLSNGSMEKIKPEIKLFLIISWVGYDVQDREKYLVLLLGHIDWSTVANDFLLEINRTENFFTSHESSLYLLLQTLFSSGIQLGPYTEAFPTLRERHSAILKEVVSSSLIQIEQEEFFPVTIIVSARPSNKDATTSTYLMDKVDCAVNTDVNSRHFEEHEAETVDAVNEKTGIDDFTGRLSQDINERFDEFGKFIESEIHELNKKECAKNYTEQTEELTKGVEPEIELKKQTARAHESRYHTRRKVITCGVIEEIDEFSECDKETEDTSEAAEICLNDKQSTHEAEFKSDTEEEAKLDNSTDMKSEFAANLPALRSTRSQANIAAQIKTPRKTSRSGKKKTPNSNKTISCNYDDCPYYTTKEDRMEKHIKTAHLSSFELRCNFCPFTSKEVRKYNIHMKTHFSGPPYKCDQPRCSFSHARISKLIRHRSEHTDERPYTCECGKSFQTNNTLAAHKKTHEGKKEFKCPICGVAFAKQNTVNQHMVTHSNVRPYLCDLCGFATKFQSHLIAHKRIHTGDVFGCSFPKCSYVTPKRSQLKAHMRAHLGVRAHVCQTCGKSFVEKSHLLRHEKLHSNERLGCSECDYTTTRKDKLREHVTKYHSPDIQEVNKPVKKQKMINTNKTRKTTNSTRKKASANPVDITTPMLVKWDHGGYSMTEETHEQPLQTEGEAIIDGNYCIIRDQITSGEPMQQTLSLNPVSDQLHETKMDISSLQPVRQTDHVLTNHHNTIITTLQNSGIVSPVVLGGNPAPIDHVPNGTIVTTVMEGDSNGQTYAIIQPAGGTTVANQEYGGLSALMSLF